MSASKPLFRIASILGLGLLIGAGISSFSAFGRPTLETDGRRTVALSYELTIREIPPAARELRFWLPLPAEGEHQTLHAFHFAGAGSVEEEVDATYGNRYLSVVVPASKLAGKEMVDFSLTATVTRRAYRVWDQAPPTDVPTVGELSLFLAPNRLVPIDGFVAEEARQVTGGASSTRERARRLYDHIVDTLRYDKSGDGLTHERMIVLCDSLKALVKQSDWDLNLSYPWEAAGDKQARPASGKDTPTRH